jgi:hypothetical protein
MSFFKAVAGIFSGGTFKSIENIATEWIETNKEKAEAKALIVKALDPNGLMRRNLSDRVTMLYTIYLMLTLFLLTLEFFGYVPSGGKQDAVAEVTNKITDLFMPISASFGLIISASFGVNYANVKGGK